MSKMDRLKEQAELLRQRAVDMLDDLQEKTLRFDLATSLKDVEEYRQKVAGNTYNVLVAGEAKRGKSSFINALIGRDLLPTDVDVATSQIFRVSQAEHDAFRLRFMDGSARSISAAELQKFGSQQAEEYQGAAHIDLDSLDCIEVDVPMPFLSDGVSVLDSPGLGSLYAAHAQITQRFVPLADAVIFVLESSGPMTRPDIAFLETILGATRYVFFIQTKIDQYDPTHWQLIQKRHQEILVKHFQGRLPDTRVWPISNRNLLQAAEVQGQGGNPAGFIRLSRQPALAEALEVFLFRVAGTNRCSDALLLADHTYLTLRQTLASRLAAFDAASTRQRTERQQEANQRLQQFEQEWEPQGTRRRELHEHMQHIAALGKLSINNMIGEGGEIERSLRQKISDLKSIAEANRLGVAMAKEVATATAGAWRTLCEDARLQYSKLLAPLVEASETLLFAPEEPSPPAWQIGPPVRIKDEWFTRISDAPGDFVAAGSTAFTVIYIAGLFYPPIWALAPIGTALGGIFGMAREWIASQEDQLAMARLKLQEYLGTVMAAARKQFLEPGITYDGTSLVTYHFNGLISAAEERIEKIVAEKSTAAQKESLRLAEQLHLDEQQRIAQQEVARQQLAEWDRLGRLLREINAQLASLEKELDK